MINPQKGIDLMNNTSIINRILFAVTIFQHLEHAKPQKRGFKMKVLSFNCRGVVSPSKKISLHRLVESTQQTFDASGDFG
jgi:hypothetical protein